MAAAHGTVLIQATPFRVVVVGAGLTGLTAAWRLRQAGCAVTVFEKSDHVGGRTRSIRQQGFVFDLGAITMLPTYVKTFALVEELGIAARVTRVSPVIGIARNGRIHRLELAHLGRTLLTTKLISLRSKLRLWRLLGPVMRTWKLATFQSLAPLADWDAETVAEFVGRELGPEVLEYIAGPIIRGNTLNGTENAPAGELLWMLRQYAAPYVYGFDEGMGFLAETLGSRLPVEFGVEVRAVNEEGVSVSLRGRRGTSEFTEVFDACVIALPPLELPGLVPRLSRGQRDFLENIVPLPSINFHLGLLRRPPATETFILPPQSEQAVLTAIVLDHNKSSGRAPEGKGVVSLFLTDEWCRQNMHRPDAELLSEVLTMVTPFIGDLRDDIETYAVQRWPYAIIKSEVGLYRRIRNYERDVDVGSRVQVGGDFLSMGMEAAVSSGNDAAERILARRAAA